MYLPTTGRCDQIVDSSLLTQNPQSSGQIARRRRKDSNCVPVSAVTFVGWDHNFTHHHSRCLAVAAVAVEVAGADC